LATVKQLAEFLGAELHGSSAVEISRVDSAAQADMSAVVFAESEAALAAALASSATAVLTRADLWSQKNGAGMTALLVPHPRLAFARAAEFLRTTAAPGGGAPHVHDTVVLGERVKLGPGVKIGPYAVLGDGVVLGAKVEIGAGCIVCDYVEIGAGSRLFPRVTIYSGTTLGKRVVVHAGAVLGADGFGYIRDPDSGAYTQFPQQGTLVLEDDVEVGANTTIDRGALEQTRIGRGTKLDNLVHIGHNVIVGQDVVIAAQTGISGSSTIGDHAIVGGQVGIGDHASVGAGAILGSGSGVLSHKKLEGTGTVFWGRPARPLRQYLKELATLAKLAHKGDSRAGDED
jgi:UDP-3-O-[3-hydroxymyristoyl] glucosamine N-acyltransferase